MLSGYRKDLHCIDVRPVSLTRSQLQCTLTNRLEVFIQKLLGSFTKNWPVTHQINGGIKVERLRFSCKTYSVALHFRKSLQCIKSVFATLYFLKILISKDIQNVCYTCSLPDRLVVHIIAVLFIVMVLPYCVKAVERGKWQSYDCFIFLWYAHRLET